MDSMSIVVVCFILIRGCGGQVNQLVPPINEAILATENVEFRCRVQQTSGLTSYITWDECITKDQGAGCRRISKDGDIQYVAQGGDPVRAEQYSISTGSTGEYNLNIAGAVLAEDAGTYVCRADNSAAFFGFAELVILDGAPVCSRNTTNPNQAEEGQYIRYVCEALYRGRWAPIIRWDEAGISIHDVKDESETNIARYSITFEVTQQHNGNIYGARVFFQTPSDTTDNEATNAPSYSYNFQFEPLIVFFGPYDLTIDWDEGCMTVGTHVTCNALGNPAPAYRWRDVSTTDIVSYDKTLKLTEDMLGFQTYKCEADNGYGRGAEEVINIQVCTTTITPAASAVTTGDVTTGTTGTNTLPMNRECEISPPHGQWCLNEGGGIAIALVVNVVTVSVAAVVTVYITRRNCPGTVRKTNGRSEQRVYVNTSDGMQGGAAITNPALYYNQGHMSRNKDGGLVVDYGRVEERGVAGTASADYVNTASIDSAHTTDTQYEDMRDMTDGSRAVPGVGEYMTTHKDAEHQGVELRSDEDRPYEPMAARSVEEVDTLARPAAAYEALNI